jgi:NAD(P)H dehydrogenase (quinone)
MTQRTLVVTGATGRIGGLVVRRLLENRDHRVVAFVRDSTKAEPLARLGAKLAQGTFEDEVSLRQAFTGADTVVLNVAGEGLAEQAATAIRAARGAGVRKVVLVSSARASLDGPTESTRQHGRADEALRASGLAFVILRPHSFMQNLLGSVGSLRAGKLFVGTADGRIGFIDVRDIADSLVSVATTDDWDGQTLDLTGPESIDGAAIAMVIGRELGREIACVAVSPEAAGEAVLRATGDAWHARTIREFAVASSSGFGDFTTDHVATLTGRAPRSLRDFVREELVPAVRGDDR